MTTLSQCSTQWASRPDDERFLNLPDMQDMMTTIREQSRQSVVSSRGMHAEPVEDGGKHKALTIIDNDTGENYDPTHYSFGQLSTLVSAPAGYLRTLPAEMAADCLNFGLYQRDVADVGVLTRKNGESILRAATGPNYGRIWNSDIVAQLMKHFGDGRTGNFRVPGEFGNEVDITKRNTTLYASDRDMFVFLADENHRIEIPGRRNGEAGSLARGFFVWNSEVGAATFGVSTFLFDYVCMNRIVWGARDIKTMTIRHTKGAPDRFMDEMQPALLAYANSSASNVVEAIEKARSARLEGDKLDDFLAKRFTKSRVAPIKAAHMADEGRPIETLWDATTGATAYARSITHQDERVKIEKIAGDIIDEASK